MPDYEEYRIFLADSSDEEALNLLRSETKRLLGPLIGLATLVSNLVEERGVPQMPDDFNLWCKLILTNARTLNDLIEATTDSRYRQDVQQEQAERDLELGELLWSDAQKGLPELRPYSSLKDAIEKIANDQKLSLAQLLSSEIRVHSDHFFPGGPVYLSGNERRARVGTRKPHTEYTGYSLVIQWLTDARNIKWDEYECLAPTLKDMINVLEYWLVEDWSLSELIEHYSWMAPNIM